MPPSSPPLAAAGDPGVPATLAVIADTHMPRGARRLPDACLERLRGADAILHAGDISAAAVLEQLRALGPPVHAVAGNVEEPALAAALPETLELTAGGARIAMVHDAGRREGRAARLARRFPQAQLVVFGHSHLPLHEPAGPVAILNPGSPTERRRAPAHTMALVRCAGGEAHPGIVALD